jgi:hypothetical protein
MKIKLNIKAMLKAVGITFDSSFAKSSKDFRVSTVTFAERLYAFARKTNMHDAIYHHVLSTFDATGAHALLRVTTQTACKYAGFRGNTDKQMDAVVLEVKTAWQAAMDALKAKGVKVTEADRGSTKTWSLVRTKDFSLEGKNKGGKGARTPAESAYFLLDNLFAIEGMTIAKARKAFDKACERHAK